MTCEVAQTRGIGIAGLHLSCDCHLASAASLMCVAEIFSLLGCVSLSGEFGGRHSVVLKFHGCLHCDHVQSLVMVHS